MTTYETWLEERTREHDAMLESVRERIAYIKAHDRERADSRYRLPGCLVAFVRYSGGGNPFAQECTMSSLCPPCEDKLRESFPQGWSYYPGDVCRHGVYVGGVGRDFMCGRCEMGE